MAISMAWAGKDVKVNSLTGKGTFNPRIPIDQPGEGGDDALIWADVPEKLSKRLKEKPQRITEDCLVENAKGVLRLYQNDIVQHVVKQQLRSEHMNSLLRRQGTYTAREQEERKSMARKLAKSSFLGRDPSEERPIPSNLWENGELGENGTLLKDVQDTVWDYLRVHLPRILGKVLLERVQQQEEMYREHPDLKEGLHNKRMPWSEYQELITYMLPKNTGMYALSRVLTMAREKDETAKSWCLRLHKGRQRVGRKMGTNLSDECYRELLFAELTIREKGELIKAQILRSQEAEHEVGDLVMADWNNEGKHYLATIIRVRDNGYMDVQYAEPFDDVETNLSRERVRGFGRVLAEARAMRTLRSTAWDTLVLRISRDIGPQPRYQARGRRGELRLYTHEQALELHADYKRQRTRGGGDARNKESKPPSMPTANRTEREKEKLNSKRKWEREGKEQEKTVKHVCLVCKEAGRRFNHPPASCNYRKGGIWYGLQGKALKEAKTKFFEERKQERKDKRKRTRESRSVSKSVTFAEPARWPWEEGEKQQEVKRCEVRKKVRVKRKRSVVRAAIREELAAAAAAASEAGAAEAEASVSTIPHSQPPSPSESTPPTSPSDLPRHAQPPSPSESTPPTSPSEEQRFAQPPSPSESTPPTSDELGESPIALSGASDGLPTRKRKGESSEGGSRKRAGDSGRPITPERKPKDLPVPPPPPSESSETTDDEPTGSPSDLRAGTGTVSWPICCGRKSCQHVHFSIVRDEPWRGPFNWQEIKVTMCEHGEMAPLLRRLKYTCRGIPKCHPHLRTAAQAKEGKGFVRPEHTPASLGLKGKDNAEMKLHVLPLNIMYAKTWPKYFRRRTYRKHYDFSMADKHELCPMQIEEETSSSSAYEIDRDTGTLTASTEAAAAASSKAKISTAEARAEKARYNQGAG